MPPRANTLRQFEQSPAIQRTFRLLAEVLTDKDVSDSVETVRGGLLATRRVRAGTSPDGKRTYEDAPDWRTRYAYLEILWRYKCIPPPKYSEVRMIHESARSHPVDAAAGLRALAAAGGSEVRDILATWVDGLAPAEPVETEAAPSADTNDLRNEVDGL